MTEERSELLKPKEELVDILLDLIVVSASLVQEILQATKEKQLKEGADSNVKNSRTGCPDYRAPEYRCRNESRCGYHQEAIQ